MFDINILVNGSRCKQHQHENKMFVQANPGSEYTIEIKNNYWKRILGVCSVDGLNVLDGKKASTDDGGYIIDSYHSEKIKGFRLSDDAWALFKFGYKFNGKTYAQSKEDGSEKNCGIIGIRLYYEYEPVINYTITTTPIYPYQPYHWPWPYWTTSLGAFSSLDYISNVQYGCCTNEPPARGVGSSLNNPLRSCNMMSDNNPKTVGMKWNFAPDINEEPTINFCSADPQPRGFDMGTEFGRKESSKVQNVSFTRGYLAHSLDIYYASRESLIEMGVPITKNLKVNLPESFPGKYCEPPKGWNG